MTSMARDVEALIRELKLESSRTILVGHSMGGMVVCDVASRLELLGVVLLGPVHPSPAMGPVFSQRIENVMKSRDCQVSARDLNLKLTGSQTELNPWPTRYPKRQRAQKLPNYIGLS